ncbi:MAG: hypothetical protein EON59_14520, partial [Alphaproteobacteria bacterium]
MSEVEPAEKRLPSRAPRPTKPVMTWRRRIEPFTRPLFFAFSRATRGMTLGVRAVAREKAKNSGRVKGSIRRRQV